MISNIWFLISAKRKLKKLLILFSSILFISSPLFPQSVSVSSTALEGIAFSFVVSGLPDSVSTVKVIIQNDSYIDEVLLNASAGKIDTSLIINETGNFNLTVLRINDKGVSVRVFPGLLSIDSLPGPERNLLFVVLEDLSERKQAWIKTFDELFFPNLNC